MSMHTPRALGYRMPAEWESHSAVWLAWPSHENLWQENLQSAQEEFTEFCRTLADVDPSTYKVRGERLHILVPTVDAGSQAEVTLRGLPVRIHLVPFGDIWLRDTAPIFLRNSEGLATVRFKFNGWGGKYALEHDPEVSKRIAELTPYPSFEFPWVLEGGSVEVDEIGTCLTSRQCLLNSNRNPEMTKEQIEAGLMEALGVQKVLWLGEGLLNDHTDGHIDTIARFVGGNRVLCMRATDKADPNQEILENIEKDLKSMTNAQGEPLKVSWIPSPGAVLNEEGNLMPASYLNFYIGNSTVVVPTYGSPHDREAVASIADYFPTRKVVGVPAKAILSGGGAFHCISQQEPG